MTTAARRPVAFVASQAASHAASLILAVLFIRAAGVRRAGGQPTLAEHPD